MALWLYLHFPSLQLDCTYQQATEQAVIVVNGKNNEVVQRNHYAAKEGVNLGMGLGAAASLCPELQVTPYDENIEKKQLVQLARWLYLITSDLALFPPNGLLLQVSNMLTLHKNVEQYWQTISNHLSAFSVQYHYATGYSPYAARLLARQKFNTISDDKNWLHQQLKKQPLSATELTPKVVEQLNKVGVFQLGELLTVSLPDLSKRFPIEVVNYIGRLLATISHKVNFYIPPERFEQYLELYYEVSNLQYLEKPLLKLYALLETHLRLRDKLACELAIVLQQRDNDELVIQVTSAQGEYKADKWWQLTELTLESVKLAAPVTGVKVRAKRLINKYAERKDLFLGSQGNVSATELVAILSAKLGSNRVRGIKLEADHRPELANQLCSPFTTHNKPETKLANKVPLRPSLLLPAPLPLQEQVSLMPYPERVITGWWDNNKAIRDYFIARSHAGRWLWVFRDQNQRWFLHGVFS